MSFPELAGDAPAAAQRPGRAGTRKWPPSSSPRAPPASPCPFQDLGQPGAQRSSGRSIAWACARRRGMAVLGTVPPQHSYGLESTVLMAMQGGLALHAGRPFYPADIRAELAALPRPRCLVTTPMHLRVLLAEAGRAAAGSIFCCARPRRCRRSSRRRPKRASPRRCTRSTAAPRPGRSPRGAPSRPTSGVRCRASRCARTSKGTWVKGGHVETEVLLGDVIELRGRREVPAARPHRGPGEHRGQAHLARASQLSPELDRRRARRRIRHARRSSATRSRG